MTTENTNKTIESDNKVKKDKPSNFMKELKHIINKYSMENSSNTPDFILARYIAQCLAAYNVAVKDRDEFFNYNPWGGGKIDLNEKHFDNSGVCGDGIVIKTK